MRTGRNAALLILLLACVACATGQPSRTPPPASAKPSSALDLVRLRDPATAWDGKSLLHADLDLDGGEDFALTGTRKDHFVVAIVHGPVAGNGRFWTLDFPWDGGEDALCSKHAKITLEPLAENPGPKAEHPAQGTGINLHDGQCDAFHIYWNPAEKKFEWWRL
jgi:hypothetical protein